MTYVICGFLGLGHIVQKTGDYWLVAFKTKTVSVNSNQCTFVTGGLYDRKGVSKK